MPSSRRMTCREVAEAITAYLEKALAPSDRDQFEAHCGTCSRCSRDLARWQEMVTSLGRLEDRPGGVTRPEEDRLLHLFREHGPHRPARPNPRVPLGVTPELVAPGDHVVYFWETGQEFDSAAGFLTAGAAEGETCVLLGHPEANERLEAAIGRAGLDVGGLQREGLLRLVTARKTPDELLGEITEQILGAVDRGSPLVRVLGNLGWGRPEWPDDQGLLRLEACVTDAVRKLPVVVMCAYSVQGITARNLLLGGVECHPLILRHSSLQTNELYVPTKQFLKALDRHPGKD